MKKNGRAHDIPDCRGKRFAIVVARFYGEIADDLVDGARRGLHDAQVADDDIDVFEVAGCFELPLACRNLIERHRYDGLVALGAVIRGETAHFDFVAGECARGIMDVQLATGVPVGFGVLTTENAKQANERAARQGGDKGHEAALAAVRVLAVGAIGAGRAGFRS